jgi:tetratricopeptide (TPR) repeat protein
LIAIHGERVLHRDIKPENILMDGQTPKIADLGIARLLSTNELASTTSGTLHYMSPEILGIEGASFTSDIWSLGVTLYEMLAGRLPFGSKGTPLKEMINLICGTADPVPVCDLRPEIPPGLAAIVARTLQKNSRERFQSAREMREAIERFESGAEDEIEGEMRAAREMLRDLQQVGLVEDKLLGLAARYPQNARVYQHLGEFYNRYQRYEDGVRAFQQGLELDPANALLHWDLALAFQRMGRRREALASLEKALSLPLGAGLRRHAEVLLKALRRR